MNAAALIPELETVLAHGSDEKRAETLRAITVLFLERADRLGDEQVRLFDGIFVRLIACVGREARAELARRLTPLSNAPVETMRVLTEDFVGDFVEQSECAVSPPQDPDAAVTALSQATAVPVEVVERIWTGSRMESVLILCKAAGYSWPATRDLILTRSAMRDKAAGLLDTARRNFHDLSDSTARRVTRFWQMAPGNLRAA